MESADVLDLRNELATQTRDLAQELDDIVNGAVGAAADRIVAAQKESTTKIVEALKRLESLLEDVAYNTGAST